MKHTRLAILKAAMEACPGLPPATGKAHRVWGPLVQRMLVLAKLEGDDAKQLATFGKVIGERLDKPEAMLEVLDADWVDVLSKVLNSVVSAKTKRERLNCATCDAADVPVMLAVIQALAYGAPSRMWGATSDAFVQHGVGRPDPEELEKTPPASHRMIAAETWYRPQLAMLVTSIWPVALSMDYYAATLDHILRAEDVDEDSDEGSCQVGESPASGDSDRGL